MCNLSQEIKRHGSLAIVQLHHAGMRSPYEVIGQKAVCPSDSPKHNARALSLAEVKQLRDDFIKAAKRSKIAGYDGVEVHGAHGYILTQFLSSDINKRADEYGGSLENRARLLFEIVNTIRQECGQDFLLGVRLSPERFGMKLDEVKHVSQRLIDEGQIDFLDFSLWDVTKEPVEKEHQHKSLLEHFTDLDRKQVKLTVAGKINSGQDVEKVLDANVDFVTIGRSAILHYDFPNQVIKNPNFKPVELPVTEEYLKKQGLGTNFVTYMKRWEGFVE